MKSNSIRYIKTVAIGVFLALLISFALLIFYLMLTDYRPDEVEAVSVENSPQKAIDKQETISLLTWNMGYAGLGKDESFFMDDGNKSKPDSLDVVKENLEGIQLTLEDESMDLILLQEVDVNSNRTYHLDEKQFFEKKWAEFGSQFALNYKVKFVPVPFPPLGEIEAGQMTLSGFKIERGERRALPGQYKWPKSLVMLDRCALVSYLPIEGSDKYLVIINAHFSAYDDGRLRAAQMAYMKTYVESLYEQGDYVILGGDWNQTFEFVDDSNFPIYMNGRFYMPHRIEPDWKPAGWKWGVAVNSPTYRLLNTAYEEGVTQVGIIDGFLVSPNVDIIATEVLDEGFEYSDHNPVKMTISLQF